MRRVVLVLVLLLFAMPASASARPAHCYGQPKRHTVVRSAAVRVYRIGVVEDDPTYYVCWRATGRAIKVSEAGGDAVAAHFVIAGRFVVFDDELFDHSYGDETIWPTVVDAQQGRIAHRWFYELFSFTRVATNSLNIVRAVAPDGSLAVLAGPFTDQQTSQGVYEVRVADATGDRVLAHGSDIQPDWLATGPGNISWIQAGVVHTAPFDPL